MYIGAVFKLIPSLAYSVSIKILYELLVKLLVLDEVVISKLSYLLKYLTSQPDRYGLK